MSSKLSESDQRYKSLGFERTFDGSAGGIQWSELIEELKTNVLRQNLRVRKLIMGSKKLLREALVAEHDQNVRRGAMPEAAIKRDELIEMIQEYDNADEERAKKRAKTAKL